MKKKLFILFVAVIGLTACGRDSVDDAVATIEQIDAVEAACGADSEAGGAAETEIETEIETETEPPAPEVHLVMVGDILLHDQVEDSARRDDGSYDFSHIFDGTRDDITAADLALVNEEVIIGGADIGVTGYPCFNAPYEIADTLVDSGFDVILHATNHAMDKGKKGLLNCIENWESKYPQISVLGIYDSQEDSENIYVYEKDGIRIAILNYTYGTNGISLPSGMPYAVNLLSEKEVVADIERAHEQADFVMVCPHWGTEYRLEKDSMQEKWTNIFLENGVDLVIGTHPHVIEPIEVLSDGEHEMVVYYSLGNFVNWTASVGPGIANRVVGGMADVTIGLDETGRTVIKDYGVVPLVCHLIPGQDGVLVYKLSDYSQELAAENVAAEKDEAFSYEYAVQLSEKIWDDRIK